MSNLVTIDLDALEADIADIREKLAEKEAVLKVARAYSVGAPSKSRAKKNGLPSAGVDVPLDRLKGKSTPDAAAAVLRAAGAPLKTADIVAALRAAGFGRNLRHMPNAVFTAMTRNKSVFYKSGPGTWQLVEQTGDSKES